MAELQCPHCTSTVFNKNSLFLECAECGTRYVLDPDGSLRRTDAFGHGEGTQHGAGQHRQTDAQGSGDTYNYNVYVGRRPQAPAGSVSPKSRTVALLLCVFLGYFGAHFFYVGRWKIGLVCLFTFGFFAYGWLFLIVWTACGKLKDANGLPVSDWG